MNNIRIVIVDDHAVVRQGLAAMLSPRNGMEVVAQATNGQEALSIVQKSMPDVIVMDLVMPKMDGLETTIAIKKLNPEARILILTSFADENRITAIMAAGASGYLMKDAGVDELIHAIRSVNSGHSVVSPAVMQMLSGQTDQKQAKMELLVNLTPREQDVLKGIVDGLTNQAIALRLGISSTTVRSHVSSILAKLDVTNRTQAALIAQEHGLL